LKNGKSEKNRIKKATVRSAKESALIAVFTAVVIALQFALYALPGIELVTVLFVSFSFTLGWKRGMAAATVFSLLRQLLFGFFPTVLCLYLLYYNLLSLLFGVFGKKVKNVYKALPFLTGTACICTLLFNVLDTALTALWYGFTPQAGKAYFLASLPFMIPQIVCTALSVALLFVPLRRVFLLVKKPLLQTARKRKNLCKNIDFYEKVCYNERKKSERSTMTYEQALQLLTKKGQTHLLRYYDDLDSQGKQNLLASIDAIVWDFERDLANPIDLSGKDGDIRPIDGLKIPAIEEKKANFEKIGIAAIKAGKVAAVLLAGGMGTRLGVDGPKGAYDIGVTKPLYIFEQQMKNLSKVNERCGVRVPLYVMTSDKNHEQTVSFWKTHGYFGYEEGEVQFFKQDMAPAVDYEGKIYLERKDAVALSPNGNGGWFSSLQRAGLVEDLKRKGVEWLNIYAVDNVLQQIADPIFVGATIESGVNCGAKVVCKTRPEEKVGVLCMDGDTPSVIEYYELTEEMANARDEHGALSYCYGVIMNYLLRLSKLEEIADKKIPVHIVEKKIECVCEDGVTRKPEKENGKKFETLVVDLIKLMGSALPFEVVREKEFAPIKNKTGVDSVESARELLRQNGVEL